MDIKILYSITIASIFSFSRSHQLFVIFIGIVVINTFKKIGIELPDTETQDRLYGIIFGKCENIIIFILILLEGYTALALIFAGKAIVRSEDKEKLSVYHLAGTMINTAYSILLAFIIKYIIGKISAFS
jgi:hypothetical protein